MTKQQNNAPICNGCGRRLRQENGICQEDFVVIRKKWGYFSSKDTEKHSLILCEACYDKLTEGLVVPPEITEDTELLYAE